MGRDHLDRYYTPDALAQAIVAAVRDELVRLDRLPGVEEVANGS